MIDLTLATTGSSVALAAGMEAAGLDEAAAMRLLAAEDPESVAQLTVWLKAHAKTFAPVVARALQEGPGLSTEAARAVLDAVVSRAPADAETALLLTEACLGPIAGHLTTSLSKGARGALSESDDSLVGSAVAILTADRRSKHSEIAIDSLAKEGPGGALVLTRAFDALRSALKLHVVRRLSPADVLALGDNVVASLARSISKLAEELESPTRDTTRFLEELGPVQRMDPFEIGATERLEAGDRVFHASWGTGTVLSSNDESTTIDFGSAGTRTLLRALATLWHAV